MLTDNPGALRHEQNAAGRTVVDVFRHLCRDLAGQIGADASNEHGGNHRSCLKDERRSRSHDPIRRCGPAIDGRIQKRKLPILRGLLSELPGQAGEIEAGNVWRGRATGRPGCRTWLGLEEDAAGAGRLFFGSTALFGFVDGRRRDRRRNNGLAPVLGVKNRSPKITGQRRT